MKIDVLKRIRMKILQFFYNYIIGTNDLPTL